MAEVTTTLTGKIKDALRISSNAEAIITEINDCIAASELDLKQVGVVNVSESDPLIIRAITLYCKAEFGYNDKAEQFRHSYDTLKMALSLMQEYNTPAEEETQTGGTE